MKKDVQNGLDRIARPALLVTDVIRARIFPKGHGPFLAGPLQPPPNGRVIIRAALSETGFQLVKIAQVHPDQQGVRPPVPDLQPALHVDDQQHAHAPIDQFAHRRDRRAIVLAVDPGPFEELAALDRGQKRLARYEIIIRPVMLADPGRPRGGRHRAPDGDLRTLQERMGNRRLADPRGTRQNDQGAGL